MPKLLFLLALAATTHWKASLNPQGNKNYELFRNSDDERVCTVYFYKSRWHAACGAEDLGIYGGPIRAQHGAERYYRKAQPSVPTNTRETKQHANTR